MTLEQTIRLQRRQAERDLRLLQALGRWPRPVRRISLWAVREAFGRKLERIRAMAEAGVQATVIRQFVRSRWAIL